ncbi:hypothetical protein KKJ09_16265 [Xenorhabdus bovienii]|uniref:hypothetical protein n=1 Tax=Xenorhabdus bovienii TaxID=40576 RepID=UPI0023B2EDF8|nr:hypothetical protein [Xenorhabdus bovienii]MDE9495095.1 hypothetical protein [Xenorhabdus bovienii]MDE9503489.1 hypothetical protein [Xenorhabdus bovienii]MDE9527212.1 hypothetical protein [Xenorhabdus bovienii]
MTIAKDSSTDEIIHGNDLRVMDDFYIKTTGFECPYERCKIKAIPCSFTVKHVNQSYFRYDDKHKDGCGIHDPRYKNKHTSNDERKHNSPPAPVISLLRLDVQPRGNAQNSEKIHGENHRNEDRGNEHPVSSSSIKPVVDYYINNKNHHEQLSIPPYGTRSYKDTFQLIFYKDNIRYFKPAIYYGVIQSNIRLQRESEKYCLTFLARNKKTKQPFTLEIDVSDWNESQKDVFWKEYEKQRREADNYYKGLQDKRNAKNFLTVFFFGMPDENDKFLFTINHFKLVYVAFLGNFENSYNNSNYYIENELSEKTTNEQLISLSDINHKNNEDDIETSLEVSSPLPEPEPEPEPEPRKLPLKENFETVEIKGKLWGGLKKIMTFFKK